ncbi:MAG: MarR family transcriptional regulator [Alphaproteobacteria bacterium]|nr:MarR family transcriptional regulator [Alphaproteobacteria bacterium]
MPGPHNPGPGRSAVNQRAIFDALDGDRCLTMDELAMRTGIDRPLLSMAAGGLIRLGLVERVAVGCFRLTEAGRASKADGSVELRSGPRGSVEKKRVVAGSLRARLWHAIRICKKFTIGDLLERAAREERQPKASASVYLQHLVAARYVRVLPQRLPGHKPGSTGYLRYVLLRDTGPLPPLVRKNRSELFDPNTGEATPCRIG